MRDRHMQTGINTTMIASIMMGLFGDRPGLCNGASGAIAVVVVDLVRPSDPHPNATRPKRAPTLTLTSVRERGDRLNWK